jgi:hypothetical protein
MPSYTVDLRVQSWPAITLQTELRSPHLRKVLCDFDEVRDHAEDHHACREMRSVALSASSRHHRTNETSERIMNSILMTTKSPKNTIAVCAPAVSTTNGTSRAKATSVTTWIPSSINLPNTVVPAAVVTNLSFQPSGPVSSREGFVM